jgi:hypothetical protein
MQQNTRTHLVLPSLPHRQAALLPIDFSSCKSNDLAEFKSSFKVLTVDCEAGSGRATFFPPLPS